MVEIRCNTSVELVTWTIHQRYLIVSAEIPWIFSELNL